MGKQNRLPSQIKKTALKYDLSDSVAEFLASLAGQYMPENEKFQMMASYARSYSESNDNKYLSSIVAKMRKAYVQIKKYVHVDQSKELAHECNLSGSAAGLVVFLAGHSISEDEKFRRMAEYASKCSETETDVHEEDLLTRMKKAYEKIKG